MGSHDDAGWLAPEAALGRFRPPAHTGTGLSAASGRRFGFQVGGVGFLIDPTLSSEVLEQLPTFPVPHTPDWLVGIANLRGNLVPVLDLARLWQWSRRAEPARLLVLDRGERAVGLVVDRLPVTLTPGQPLAMPPPLPAILRDHIIAAYTKEETLWLDYDHHGLFQSIAAQLR